MARYAICTDDDGQYSADPGDYWHYPDSQPIGALVRLDHAWRTATGQLVHAPRCIKLNATVGDLRRLARVPASGLIR